MADVYKTRAQLVTAFADNTAGSITAQLLRDYLYSTIILASNGQMDIGAATTPLKLPASINLDLNGNNVLHGGTVSFDTANITSDGSGNLTAVSFVGNLTGNVTGNVTGTLIGNTITGSPQISGNLNVQGTTVLDGAAVPGGAIVTDGNGNMDFTPGGGTISGAVFKSDTHEVTALGVFLLDATAALAYQGNVIAAAGNSQGTGTAFSRGRTRVTGADNTAGVTASSYVFPNIGDLDIIENADTTHKLLVYPYTSKTINGGSADAAVTVPPRSSLLLIPLTGGTDAAAYILPSASNTALTTSTISDSVAKAAINALCAYLNVAVS